MSRSLLQLIDSSICYRIEAIACDYGASQIVHGSGRLIKSAFWQPFLLDQAATPSNHQSSTHASRPKEATQASPFPQHDAIAVADNLSLICFVQRAQAIEVASPCRSYPLPERRQAHRCLLLPDQTAAKNMCRFSCPGRAAGMISKCAGENDLPLKTAVFLFGWTCSMFLEIPTLL
jgi:hypothetical protein